MMQRELPLGERPVRNVESFESVVRTLRAEGLGGEIDEHIAKRERRMARNGYCIVLLTMFTYVVGIVGILAFTAYVWGCFNYWDFGWNAIARDYGLMAAAILLSSSLGLWHLLERLADRHTRMLKHMQEQKAVIEASRA